MKLPDFLVDEVIRRALAEDMHYYDVTTDLLIDPEVTGRARFVAKAGGVLCGMDIALRVFSLLDGGFSAVVYKEDGDRVEPGDLLAELMGKTSFLLKGERTALNLVQHLSGIATETARCVALVAGTGAAVADTRKTLPGLRALQKYAVLIGGGRNHRFNLSDGAMLKDNHIDAAGGIAPAVAAVRAGLGHMVRLEVEARTLDEVREAADAGADVILFDNMDPATMRRAVDIVSGRAVTEASGGITADTLRPAAESGVDLISIGALTHSVRALDISMQYVK